MTLGSQDDFRATDLYQQMEIDDDVLVRRVERLMSVVRDAGYSLAKVRIDTSSMDLELVREDVKSTSSSSSDGTSEPQIEGELERAERIAAERPPIRGYRDRARENLWRRMREEA